MGQALPTKRHDCASPPGQWFPLMALPVELVVHILLTRFKQMHRKGELRLLLHLSETCWQLYQMIKHRITPEIDCIHGYTMSKVRPSMQYLQFRDSLTALDLSPKLDWWYGETDPDSHRLVYLKNFTRLKSLCLGSSAEFDDTDLKVLTQLTRLDLSENETITDKALGQLTRLTWLNLSDNPVISNSGLSHLTNLTHLNLSWHKPDKSQITYHCLHLLTGLTSLNMMGNRTISHTDARSILPTAHVYAVMREHRNSCKLCQ